MRRLMPVVSPGIVLLTLILVGCVQDSPPDSDAGRVEVEIDADGSRRVRIASVVALELAQVPRTVLPTSASAADIVLDLLPAERITGFTDLAFEYSKLATYEEVPAELAAKPRMGAFEPEIVLDWKPDLILTHAWQDPALLAAVDRHGVPSLPLPITGTWHDMTRQIECVAEVLDVQARGAELLVELETRRKALAERGRALAADHPLRLMSFSSYGDALWTAGENSTYDLMIELTGQVNAAVEAGLQGNVQIRLEELLGLDPDVIFSGGGAGTTGLEILRSHPSLQGLRVVREPERFIELPGHLFSSASHEVLRAAEVLLERLEQLPQ